MSSDLLVQNTSCFYGLFHTENKRLLTYTETDNTCGYACNSTTVRLSEDPNNPVFTTHSIELAYYALQINTDWYNSSRTTPSHGNVDMTKCQVVTVTEEVTIKAVDSKPIKVASIENYLTTGGFSRTKPRLLLIKSGNELEPGDKFISYDYRLWHVLERYNKQTVPEEFADDLTEDSYIIEAKQDRDVFTLEDEASQQRSEKKC